jgi:hypothetical protein
MRAPKRVEANALVRPDVEPPFLPLHHVAVELEAGTQRLIDPHRTGHLARLADRCRVVVGDGFRHRYHTLINHPQHVLGVEVNDGSET